jgi:5-methylcytosine-specific restriction endonuclease McrBC GTP-binding regulatory subunit McrB
MFRETIKFSAKDGLGYYELKKHKLWFDKECSESLDQRKQAKLQWIHDSSEINGDNLYNARHESSRHFKNKKRKYLNDKINDIAKNIRKRTL